MDEQGWYQEGILTVIAAVLLLLCVMLYNPELFQVYISLLLISVIAYVFTRPEHRISFNLLKKNSSKQLFIGVIAFIIFAFISLALNGVTGHAIVGNDIIEAVTAPLVGSFASIPQYAPILAAFPAPETIKNIVTFFVFAFLITFIETQAIARIYNVFIDRLNIPMRLDNIKMWAVIAIVGVAFMFLHIKVRGLDFSANIPLLLTLLFGICQCVLILILMQRNRNAEFEGAWYQHAIWNGLIMFKKLGVF
jgi:hypothetical protein